MAAPVTSVAESPASQTIRLATEAGCTHCETSAPGMALRLAGGSIVPARMTLAVMPASLYSRATVRISDTSAALDALLARTVGPGISVSRLSLAMMRPALSLGRG